MTSNEFVKLYAKSELDELVTPFTNGIGFSLVRKYKQGSEYYEDDKRLFIKLLLSDDNLVNGSVNMVDSDKEKTGSYRIATDNKYKKRVTNFHFGNEEKIFLNDGKVLYKSRELSFTINDFVEIMVNNHLSDRVFWRRKLNYLIDIFLKLIFWLSDKHYEKIDAMMEIHSIRRKDEHNKDDEKSIEPFFKYFFITKNILFSLLLVAFSFSILLTYLFCSRDFSMSNPSVILFFFLILFSIEKLSILLDKKIKAFFKKETNFIYQLHSYQFNESFKLKFKK